MGKTFREDVYNAGRKMVDILAVEMCTSGDRLDLKFEIELG